MAKMLARFGLIGQIDGLMLRMLVESIDLYLTATEKLTSGLIAKTTNGNLIQNPYLAVRNRMWEQVVSLARDFGLTPADRTGMSFSPVPGTDPIGLHARDRYAIGDKNRFFNDLPRGMKPQ